MPRRPPPVGSWGRIARTEVEPKRWVARARFRDPDGVTRKVEAWGVTGAAAERTLVESLTTRIAPSSANITPSTRLRDLAERWFVEEVEGNDRSTNTRNRYRYVLDQYVIPGVGALMVREVSTGSMNRFLKKTTTNTGAATAKLCRSVLSGMLQLAVIEDAVKTNPMRDVSPISVETTTVRALTAGEARTLRAALRADPKAVSIDLHRLVDVMLATGCRVGEALALRWSDVDLTKELLTLSGTVVRGPGGLERQSNLKGKKAKDPRTVHLPKYAVEALVEQRVTVHPGDLDLVFPSATGGLREVSTVDKQWRTFRRTLEGFEWVSPHTFRKTTATAIERVDGLGAASKVLGHSRSAVTAKHYIEASGVAPDVSETLQAFIESAG